MAMAGTAPCCSSRQLAGPPQACPRHAGAAARWQRPDPWAAPAAAHRRRAAAAQGGGAASFNADPSSGEGKEGTASFAAAPPPADDADAGLLAGLQKKLQSLGLAGVVAYDAWAILLGVGLFNTLYYTGAFAFFWHLAKVPRGQGLAAAARSFAVVFGGVYAGSQVTKAPRAAAALALAPFVDKLLNWAVERLGFKTRKQVFAVFLAGCITLALSLFGLTVLAWA